MKPATFQLSPLGWNSSPIQNTGDIFACGKRFFLGGRQTRSPPKRQNAQNFNLLTKWAASTAGAGGCSKKDASRRHMVRLTIRFRSNAVTDKRQWSSAASEPRRRRLPKTQPYFCGAYEGTVQRHFQFLQKVPLRY